MRRFIKSLACTVAVAALGISGNATAKYPDRPIQLLVPAAAGGATSLVGRVIAQQLEKELGQPLVLVNRGGGGGRIATGEVARATPDGYTLLITFGGPVASGVGLFKTMAYDVERDLAPIALVAELQILLVASPSFAAKNVQEVISYARANPGKMTASISSVGSMGHLMTEMFVNKNNIKINSIPYKGSGEAMKDILAGRIDVAFDTLPTLVPFVNKKDIRALAVASKERSPFLPDTATLEELGMPGMEAAVWYAMFAPAGTPPDVIDTLSKAIAKTLQSPEVKQSMANLGIVPRFASPTATRQFVRDETVKWNKVIRDAGIEKSQ